MNETLWLFVLNYTKGFCINSVENLWMTIIYSIHLSEAFLTHLPYITILKLMFLLGWRNSLHNSLERILCCCIINLYEDRFLNYLLKQWGQRDRS